MNIYEYNIWKKHKAQLILGLVVLCIILIVKFIEFIIKLF